MCGCMHTSNLTSDWLRVFLCLHKRVCALVCLCGLTGGGVCVCVCLGGVPS